MLRRLLPAILFSALLACALFAALAWLLCTAAGLRASAAIATQLSGDRLRLERPQGRLIDGLRLDHLEWQDKALHIRIDGIALDWSPLELLGGTLHIQSLRLGGIDVSTVAAADTPSEAPRVPALPIGVTLDALDTGRLLVNGTVIADHIDASFQSHGEHHRLGHLALQRSGMQLDASGDISAQAPYPLALDAQLSGRYGEQSESGVRPFVMTLSARGSLARLDASMRQKEGPFSLQGQAVLRPLANTAADMIQALSLTAERLDLAMLLPELPHTLIDAHCQMLAGAKGSGSDPKEGEPGAKPQIPPEGCSLRNGRDGPVDQNLLPLKQLSARLVYRDAQLRFEDLRIRIGSSELKGSAEAGPDGVAVHLNAHELDLAALHSRMRHTHLHGPISLDANATRQTVSAALTQDSLKVRTEVVKQGDTLKLAAFELSARDARLAMEGALQIDTRRFSGNGRFAHFDPAQFVHAPHGNLNGNFNIAGSLQSALQAQLSFALDQSRFAAAPANGRGRVEIAWPRIPQADVALTLGKNRLRLHGAFGRAGDTLRLDVDAPALSPYGIDGDLQAHLRLAGTLAAPQLAGRIESTRLRLAGYGIEGLNMHADVGSAPTAPFALNLSLARLDLASRRNALSQLGIEVQGTRKRHRINVQASLYDDQALTLAAQGGLDVAPGAAKSTSKAGAGVEPESGPSWQGSITQLQLRSVDGERFIRLVDPTPLVLAASHWRMGRADLQTPRARVALQASAQAANMRADILVKNPQLGEVHLNLQGKPASAWALSSQMPWQGRLRADISELAWANPLLGGAWRAGGRLHADIGIGGTPQFPLLNGTIGGDDLSLRHLDTAMHLQHGILRAMLHDSVLDLNTFEIESALTKAVPPAVQKLMGAKAQELTAKPGRITARGRLALANAAGAGNELNLDVSLDRLGVSQTAKQWLVLSGRSQINWRQSKLGVDAQLRVDAAHWQLADISRPQLSNDVVVHREGRSQPRKITPWTGRIRVDLGRYFSFAGAGARGRLAGQVDIVATAQDLPRASGTVHLVDGRYDAYGQQLDIERGILNFQGLLENPALNIRALRKGLPVEAGVEITGFAQNPRIRLVSEPDVPDTEKLSWLVLGRPPDQEGADASILLSAMGAIFGNDISGAGEHVKQGIGIDEISVRNGALGQQQTTGSRIVSLGGPSQSSGQVLTVGKQLSDRLRLSYEQALGATGNLVKLSFKLSDRLSLVGTSGSDAALDLFYSFAFGGSKGDEREKKR